MPAIACKNEHLELYLDDVTDEQLELINRVHDSLSSDNHVVDYKGNKYLAASIIYTTGIKGNKVEIELLPTI